MIEIILLIVLCMVVGDKARQRGRRALRYQVAAVAAWIVFGVLGGFVGSRVLPESFASARPPFLSLVDAGALLGSCIGGLLIYILVRSRPAAGPVVGPKDPDRE